MRILVTGGTGMVGNAFSRSNTGHKLTLVGSMQYDLTDYCTAVEMLTHHQPDAVIHLAARVGGVKGNSEFVADFYSENIRINTNVLDASHKCNVKKVVSLLSTCVYPDDVRYPLVEEQIHSGPPHRSNFGYAYAKRMLDVHSRALRQQYNRNYICAVPNNLYGPGDNFDLDNGHVIPAVIRKVWESKISKEPPIFWGSGEALREFTFSKDISTALIYLLENYDGACPINIGVTSERSISDVVHIVCKELDYTGKIVWDDSKPTGQLRKPSSNKRFLETGWDPALYTTFEDGISETCKWFMHNYPEVRGVMNNLSDCDIIKTC